MNFEVVWDVEAYREFQRIWDLARGAGPAVDAFDEIERRLATSPENEGESRPRGRRVLIVLPLGVIYRVQPRLNEVHILDVWHFKPRTL